MSPDSRHASTPQPNAPIEATDSCYLTAPGAPVSEGSPSEALPTRIGNYSILGKIGEGGMGMVYLAEDARLGRKAALKTMRPEMAADPESRERFLREAKAAAAVEHDNIVPIWQVGELADGSPFLAMPFLRGESLAARLHREPVAPLGLLLKVAREVADGLVAAHACGLVHRDIKPGNVWIEGDPSAAEPSQQVRRCKILDFGLARPVSSADTQITTLGMVLGTPAYMAPEQARGEAVDHRADLFSLGVLLYRMATGRQPFRGPNVMAILTELATVTPRPVSSSNSSLPTALAALIDRLICKDPAGRPQSAAEVSATVRRITEDLLAHRPAPSGGEATAALPPPIPPRSNRTGWVIASVALLALLPLAVWKAVVVLRMETPKGTLIVEISGDEAEARMKGGKLILTGPDGKDRYTLALSDRGKKLEAGAYKIRVEGADGLVLDTPEFTIEKGGEVVVRVTAVPNQLANPDRTATVWVLSIGGTVRINGTTDDIKSAADLPRDAFRLTYALMSSNPKVTDAGLAAFAGCKDLEELHLHHTKAGNEGMAHFKNCKKLTLLHLDLTLVTDKGLAYFKGCKKLKYLHLYNTRVSDAGMEHFRDCDGLTTLSLSNSDVGDAGVAIFKGSKSLTDLQLHGTKIGDDGVAHFKGCAQLMHLALGRTRVTNAGLAHLNACGKLVYLGLVGTAIDDAGLENFKDHPALSFLGLDETRVTDRGMATLKGCKRLHEIALHGTAVGDPGLTHLAECELLVKVGLTRTKVTADGVERFKKAKPKCEVDWTGKP